MIYLQLSTSVPCTLFYFTQYYVPNKILIFIGMGMLTLCESQDEDPLDLCAPVNCHMKYQGFRSMFDTIKRQCVTIPICDGKSNNGNSSNIVIT